MVFDGFDVLATNTSPLDPVTKPDMTIHTDISEIIGKCRHDLTLEASFSPGGYSMNLYTGRLRPRSNPLPFYIPFFTEKVPL